MDEQDVKDNDNNQQEQSGNMYSYRNDNVNIKQSEAIRRSLGEGNPSGYPQNKFGSNPNNYNNDNDGSNSLNISQKSSESSSNTNLFFLPYIILASIQVAITLALSLLIEYDFEIREIEGETYEKKLNGDDIYFNYGQLRDMSIIIFIGFGLLHTILKKNAWASMSINTLIVALSIEIALFFNYVWKKGFKERWDNEYLDYFYLNKAIFISCAVVITYGCVLGKLSVIQYVIMATLEIILATMNFQLCQEKLQTIDTGGSLYIHTFGAIFALSITVVLYCPIKANMMLFDTKNNPSYFSSITSFLGVLFLFVYFPSLNSILSEEIPNINRAKINTYLSLFGAVMGSFVTSGIINEGRIVLEHILYGTLSGGIIISGCCSVCLYHWAALIIGTVGAAIAVVFLSFIKPIFFRLGLRDTCNVIIIHGIFGLLGGFISPMFIAGLDSEDITNFNLFIDSSRSNRKQAGIQVGALFITLGISFIGGIATGFLMKISTCGKLNWFFDDNQFFNIDNYEQQFQEGDKGFQPSYN
jgi:ammonium transporter Rh